MKAFLDASKCLSVSHGFNPVRSQQRIHQLPAAAAAVLYLSAHFCFPLHRFGIDFLPSSHHSLASTLIRSWLTLHFLLLSYHQRSVTLSVFQNSWNPRNLRWLSQAAPQDSLLLMSHILGAQHRNVCLGCASLRLAVSFARPSVTPCCFVPDSDFLFLGSVPPYDCTAKFHFLVCTFPHFPDAEHVHVSLPVASDN